MWFVRLYTLICLFYNSESVNNGSYYSSVSRWQHYVLELTRSVILLGRLDATMDKAIATISKSYSVFTAVCRDENNYYHPVYGSVPMIAPCGKLMVEPQPNGNKSDFHLNWSFFSPPLLGVNLTFTTFHLRNYHGSCVVENLAIAVLDKRVDIFCGHMAPWSVLVQSINMGMTYTNLLTHRENNTTQLFGFAAHYSFYNIREAFGTKVYTLKIDKAAIPMHHSQLNFDRFQPGGSFNLHLGSLPGFVTVDTVRYSVLIQTDSIYNVLVRDWQIANPVTTEIQMFAGPTTEAQLIDNNLSTESFVLLLVVTQQIGNVSFDNTVDANVSVDTRERNSRRIWTNPVNMEVRLDDYCANKVVCDITFTAGEWATHPKFVDLSVVRLNNNGTNPPGCQNYGLMILNEVIVNDFINKKGSVLYLCDNSAIWSEASSEMWPSRAVSMTNTVRLIYYRFHHRERNLVVSLLARTTLCRGINILPKYEPYKELDDLHRLVVAEMSYVNGRFLCSTKYIHYFVSIPNLKVCFGDNGTHRAVTIKATLDIGCYVMQQLLQTVGREKPIIVSIETLSGPQLISNKVQLKTLGTNFCQSHTAIVDSNQFTIHSECHSVITDVRLQLKSPLNMKGTLKTFEFSSYGFYRGGNYFKVKILTEQLQAYPHKSRHVLSLHNSNDDIIYYIPQAIYDRYLSVSSATKHTFSINGSNCGNRSINYRIVLMSGPLTQASVMELTVSATSNGSFMLGPGQTYSITDTQSAKMRFLFFDINSYMSGNCTMEILTELIHIAQALGLPSHSHCGAWCDKYTREYIIVWQEMSVTWTYVHEACSSYGANLPSILSKSDEHLLKKLITGETLGGGGQEFYLSPARLLQDTFIPVGLNLGKVI